MLREETKIKHSGGRPKKQARGIPKEGGSVRCLLGPHEWEDQLAGAQGALLWGGARGVGGWSGQIATWGVASMP